MVDNSVKESEALAGKAGENSTITIRIPPPSHADDASLAQTLADVVNAVYKEAEHDIFLPSYQRTFPEEVAGFIRKGQLAVAYLTSTDEPVGCVAIKLLSSDRGQFGMFALDTKLQGGGLGKQMALFAQDECRRRGCTTMQLELLVPTTVQHLGKERMQAWYTRLGYSLVKLGSFEEDYPDLAKILAGPTEYRIFEKSLV
ncbi:hypothetical protein FALBO_12818 [Fusarium albosuccineum]|uniref:N-acetyltransferase domain-containing protein n=1 Tax=Fusarium albosuccineum TaxID=1237068 RepID=A0A8H4L150_9HYPO|nr:hypothetical protein FALBO_12818 [Fusarium albosuccineum]